MQGRVEHIKEMMFGQWVGFSLGGWVVYDQQTSRQLGYVWRV